MSTPKRIHGINVLPRERVEIKPPPATSNPIQRRGQITQSVRRVIQLHRDVLNALRNR